MALDKQNVPVVFGKMDAGKTDPKLIPAGGLVLVENMRPGRDGELEKRHGVTALPVSTSGGTAITVGTDLMSLTAHGDELLMRSGNTIYSFAETNDRWYSKGTHIPASVQVKGCASGDVRSFTSSSVYVGGLVVSAWFATSTVSGATGVYYSVVDYVTGQILVPATLVEAQAAATISGTQDSLNPKLAVVGTSAHIYWHVPTGSGGTSGYIRAARVQAATPTTLSAVSNIVTNAAMPTIVPGAITARMHYDVISDGTYAYLVYGNDDTTNAFLRTAKVSESFTVTPTGSTTLGVVANYGTICCGWLDYAGTNGNMYFVAAIADNPTLKIQLYSVSTSTMAITSVATLRTGTETAFVRHITGWHNGTTYEAYWQVYRNSVPGASPTNQAVWKATDAGNGAAWWPNVQIYGHAFKAGSTYYLPLAYYMQSSSYQGCYGIADTSKNAVAYVLPSEGGASYDDFGSASPATGFLRTGISRITLASPTKAVIGALRLVNVADVGFQPCYFDLDLAPSLGPSMVAGDELYAPGGITKVYDGERLSEAGFFAFPEVPVLTTAGGGACTAGVHAVRLVWSWRDSLGNLHRSAPSLAVNNTINAGGGGATITAYFQHLTVTGKTNVLCIAYMTTAGGSIYYRVPTASGYADVVPTLSTGGLTISIADTDLALQQTLYTEGGVLDNDAAPPSTAGFVAKNRLWLLGLDDIHSVMFSKEMVKGEGVAFSLDQEVRADDSYGGFTAGSALDDKVVLFKTHAIYALYGDGPDDTGNGSFSVPQRLPMQVGTSVPKSVIEAPPGVFFFYDGMIYLISRGLDVVPIGLPVKDYTDSATISGAVTWPEEQEVRFYTTGGRTLVYNWINDLWTTFTGQAAVAATRWEDTMVYLSSAGVVHQEDETKYFDLTATPINSLVKTGWINFEGLEGFQRLYTIQVLGEYKAAHNLKVSIWYDYATGTASETWTKAVSAGPQRFEVKPSRQTCSAFQLQIEDTYAAASTEGFRLTGVSCIVGMKQGRGRGVTRIAP